MSDLNPEGEDSKFKIRDFMGFLNKNFIWPLQYYPRLVNRDVSDLAS